MIEFIICVVFITLMFLVSEGGPIYPYRRNKKIEPQQNPVVTNRIKKLKDLGI